MEWRQIAKKDSQQECWQLQSRIIVLEEENRKLRNRLSAYTRKR